MGKLSRDVRTDNRRNPFFQPEKPEEPEETEEPEEPEELEEPEEPAILLLFSMRPAAMGPNRWK
jgi:hypothetical protein